MVSNGIARAAMTVAVCSLSLSGVACRDTGSAPPPTVADEGNAGHAVVEGTAAPAPSGAPGDDLAKAPADGRVAAPSTPAAAAPPSMSFAVGGLGHAAGARAPHVAPPYAPDETQFGIIGLTGGAGSAGAWGSAKGERGEAPLVQAAAPVVHLDPNARYSTTYRPGGASLAAFDAAQSRGQIPAVYRDLVGAFGARYALDAPPPSEGALAVSVRTDRAAAAPEGGPMNVAVTLASSAALPARAPLSVHIVLDTSGSMSGRAIDDARQAAAAVVAKLDDGDRFSMVTFSNDASVLVPGGAIGPRRSWVTARIAGVHADGGTNIAAALDLAYTQANNDAAPDDAVRIVMLLSDGYANVGDTDPQRLAARAARAFQSGVQTSAFGLGGDYDAALMSRIADRGAGGYYYLADSSQIAAALATEIDSRMRPVATAVEVRFRVRPDVVPTHVFGSRELSDAEVSAVRSQELAIDGRETRRGIAADRQTDAAGGMRFFIPSFAGADRHTTMITLVVPPGAGPQTLASVEVRYKDRLLHRNVAREVPVRVERAPSDAASATTRDRAVEPLAQAFAAGETILDAAERVDARDRDGARALLDERAEILRRAADALGDARLVEDAGRVARLATAVGGSGCNGSACDPLPLVVMLRGSGYGYL